MFFKKEEPDILAPPKPFEAFEGKDFDRMESKMDSFLSEENNLDEDNDREETFIKNKDLKFRGKKSSNKDKKTSVDDKDIKKGILDSVKNIEKNFEKTIKSAIHKREKKAAEKNETNAIKASKRGQEMPDIENPLMKELSFDDNDLIDIDSDGLNNDANILDGTDKDSFLTENSLDDKRDDIGLKKEKKKPGFFAKLNFKKKSRDNKNVDIETELKPADDELNSFVEKPLEVSFAEKEIEKAISELKNPIPSKKDKMPFFSKKNLISENNAENESRNSIYALKDKIHESREALMEFNLPKAKRLYIEIMQKYNELSEGEQSMVYYEINDLYNERKNAESMHLRHSRV